MRVAPQNNVVHRFMASLQTRCETQGRDLSRPKTEISIVHVILWTYPAAKSQRFSEDTARRRIYVVWVMMIRTAMKMSATPPAICACLSNHAPTRAPNKTAN